MERREGKSTYREIKIIKKRREKRKNLGVMQTEKGSYTREKNGKKKQ